MIIIIIIILFHSFRSFRLFRVLVHALQNCAAYYRTISEQKRKLMTCRFFTISKMAKAIHVEVLKIIQYTIKTIKIIIYKN